MAIIISQGSGATVATESISGQHYGYNKITDASLGGSATVGMIVDSSANASGAAHVFLRGNVTINPVDPKTFIGLVTVQAADPKGFIGLVTVGNVVNSNTTMTGLPPFNSSPTVQPFGQFLSPQSLISLGSGAFGPIVVDQYGRQVMGTGNAYIGLASVNVGAIADSKGYIGLVTATPGGAWPDPKTFIGSVSVTGIVGIGGNVTLSDPKTFIGSVSVGGIVDSKGFIGLVTTQAADPKGFVGLVTVGGISTLTLSDPKGYIGLVTVGGIGTVTLADPKGFIGLTTAVIGNPTIQPFGQFYNQASLVSLASGGFGPIVVDQYGRQAMGNSLANIGFATIANSLAWPDPKTYIGLTTIDIGTNNKVGLVGSTTLIDAKSFIGLVTVGGISTLTLADPKGYIGLVTIGGIGTVTLADPKGFIGLVTIGGGSNFIGIVTITNRSNLIKTVQTNLLGLTSIGPNNQTSAAISAVQAVTTNLAASIFIDHAWVVTSNPSVGTEYLIEVSQQASNNDTWVPLTTFRANNVAASLASTVAANNVAGATVVAVTVGNPGFQAGDRIYFANPNLANAEFNRILNISGATITLYDGLKNTQNGVQVFNRAERYVANLDLSSFTRLRAVVNNTGISDIGQIIAACNARIALITGDSIN